MQNTIDIGWLDIGVQEDSRLAVLNQGRLQRVIDDLPDPDTQHPSLCVFFSGKTKNHALQHLYPLNNIKRHSSATLIKLRSNITSLQSRQPVLLADSDIPHTKNTCPTRRLNAGMGLPVSWDNGSTDKVLQVLWSQLIFLFTNVVCIFIDNTSELDDAARFLIECLRLRSASSFPPSLLPRAIFIYGAGIEQGGTEIEGGHPLYFKIHNAGFSDISGIFSGTTSIYLQPGPLSYVAKYQRLHALVADQTDKLSYTQQEYQGLPTATHFTALFQSAFRHTVDNNNSPFDAVRATREDRPVNLCAESHLAHYLEVGLCANIRPDELTPAIATALFMNHYTPGMLGM